MLLATTTEDFSCVKDHIEQVRLLRETGFRHVDLSMYKVVEGDPLFGCNWRAYVCRLKAVTEELGMTYVQAHSPNTNNMDGDAGFADAVEKTTRAIEICGILGIPNLVVHAGWSRDVTEKKVWFAENRRFFSALFPVMEKCGVNVLCENTTKANMPTWYYLITGADMREFIDYVDHPRFGGCWDTGHANVEGHQYDEIVALGDKLLGIHFNDNRGRQDEHIIPFMGILNVDEVMSALQTIGYKGAFTFECTSALRPKNYWLGNRRSFEGGLSEPPLSLKKQLEAFLYEVGKYILSAYGCWEESE